MMNNSDPRLRDFITPDPVPGTSVRIIGFPSDEGVKINGGRPGASQAPELIFEQLMKLTPHAHWYERHTELLSSTCGITMVSCTGSVEKDQEQLGEIVTDCLNQGQLPVIIGGGHDTSFGHFLGYAGAGRSVRILNMDAHADVRPLKDGKAHSGSPFRQALEHPSKSCHSYSVFGLNPASVSAGHLRYVNKHGLAVYESDLKRSGVRKWFESAAKEGTPVMATMDMDLVNQAGAPGVSAPNSSGITTRKWLRLAFELGRQPEVASFDLCEVNPEFDRDGQTVRLAALTIWNFLLGVALR
jgi:formiminoglutamase